MIRTTTAFINWLKANPAKLNRSPVFWTGKNGRKGAINAANLLKNNKAIVGPQGGFTVFDAVKEADANTKDWTANDDWAKACEAFAEHAQPESKKAFLVYGKEVDPVLNIWNNNEWPKLETNSHVTEVETYEMHDDGRGVTAKGEIKKSKKGNPIKSA
ncbi:hypothetical protein H0H87_007032 [Tephrocybe sp. NHM501043]|nr:hypothetical protein H0H87_007032 [Tephrocybe sp. NHM501043]